MKTIEALNNALEFVEELGRELTLCSRLEAKRGQLEQELTRALAAQPARQPFGWWFTEDPDVFCMPGSGFRRFPDKPQHTIECIALYTIEGQ